MPRYVKGAGDLDWRVQLLRRGLVDDGYSNLLASGEYEYVATIWAHMQPLVGSESVQAARLGGKQPYVLTVRQSATTRAIDETWRLADDRNPNRNFAVTAPPIDPDGDRAWLEILIVEGKGG